MQKIVAAVVLVLTLLMTGLPASANTNASADGVRPSSSADGVRPLPSIPNSEVSDFAKALAQAGFPQSVPLPNGKMLDLRTYARVQLQIARVRKSNPAQAELDMRSYLGVVPIPSNQVATRAYRASGGFKVLNAPFAAPVAPSVIKDLYARVARVGQFMAALWDKCKADWFPNNNVCELDLVSGSLSTPATPFPSGTPTPPPTPAPDATVSDLSGNQGQADINNMISDVHALQSASPGTVPSPSSTAFASALSAARAGPTANPSARPQPLPQVTLQPAFTVGRATVAAAVINTTFTPPTFDINSGTTPAFGADATTTILLNSDVLGLHGDPTNPTAVVDATIAIPHDGGAPFVTVSATVLGNQVSKRTFTFLASSATNTTPLKWAETRAQGVPINLCAFTPQPHSLGTTGLTLSLAFSCPGILQYELEALAQPDEAYVKLAPALHLDVSGSADLAGAEGLINFGITANVQALDVDARVGGFADVFPDVAMVPAGGSLSQAPGMLVTEGYGFYNLNALGGDVFVSGDVAGHLRTKLRVIHWNAPINLQQPGPQPSPAVIKLWKPVPSP